MFTYLGYSVVDTGFAPENKGSPTLIAIINAQQDPHKKDLIYYSMKLYKPLSSSNSLLNCNNRQQNHNICISPQTIVDAQQLFTTNCTYFGTANIAAFIMKYCVKVPFSPILKVAINALSTQPKNNLW